MRSLVRYLPLFSLCCLISLGEKATCAANLHNAIRQAQRKVVKIYGAGGLRQMEAYQTGILISPAGHVLTAQSYVLDTDDLVVVLDDGRKLYPTVLSSDPVRELAVLQPRKEVDGLPHFDFSSTAAGTEGQRVLALSNLYNIATGDESASVLQGVITAVAPLDARRGSRRTLYRKQVYVLDAPANNPGAAGGALVDWQGQLVGVLGKELRSRTTGTWLNYALPASEIAPTVEQLLSGRDAENLNDHDLVADDPLSVGALGFALVPDVLRRTPPYVDSVSADTPSADVGLRADDLVVLVDDQPIASCQALREVLSQIELQSEVAISVLRDGELLTLLMQVESEPAGADDTAEAELP